MKQFLIALIVIFSLSISAKSQTKKDLKRIYINGEFSLLYEEYREALPFFLELYDAGRRDANIKHRIGLCYLNIPNQKENAIKYLEEAVENVSESYGEGIYTEREAPIETYLYLGMAYRVSNRLEDAIEAFNKYKELLDPKDEEQNKIVNAEIISCKNALELTKIPTSIFESNLGKNINTQFNNVNPLVSVDEETIVFVSELRFYDGIFSSKKRDGRSLPARNISLDFNSDNPLTPVYLTKDGKFFFPQVIDIEEMENKKREAEEQANAEKEKAVTEMEKNDKPKVEIYVMSHCPYGTQIEKGMLPVLETLGDKIDFELKFCTYAMHGEKELQEQLRQ